MRHIRREIQNKAQQTSLGGKPGVPGISKETIIFHLGMFSSSSGLDCSASQRAAWPHNWKIGWKWGGGMRYRSLCAPQRCLCPDVVSVLGWPQGTWPHPSPWPLTGLPSLSLLSLLAQVLKCAILPQGPSPFFFCRNCLKLISSSSAHHSSLFDDTNQAVGGFVMAVSDTLIKAISISRRKHYMI